MTERRLRDLAESEEAVGSVTDEQFWNPAQPKPPPTRIGGAGMGEREPYTMTLAEARELGLTEEVRV